MLQVVQLLIIWYSITFYVYKLFNYCRYVQRLSEALVHMKYFFAAKPPECLNHLVQNRLVSVTLSPPVHFHPPSTFPAPPHPCPFTQQPSPLPIVPRNLLMLSFRI